MNVFLGLLCIAAYLVYKRSSEIIKVNPMSQVKSSDTPDFAAIVSTISEAARQASAGAHPEAILPQTKGGRERQAIVAMVKNNQFIEAIQLYKRLYGVDLAAAKKAVDEIMLNQ